MDKLLTILNEGEGHSIFPTKEVISALEETKIGVTKTKNTLILFYNNKKSTIFLTKKPKRKPRSKYDVEYWPESLGEDGVWDLALIRALVDLCDKEYYGGEYSGRGFQYRAYYEWLNKELLEKELEEVTNE